MFANDSAHKKIHIRQVLVYQKIEEKVHKKDQIYRLGKLIKIR